MAEKLIGGRTFRVTPLLITEALILQARLAKVVGPAISQLVTAFDRSDESKSNAAAIAAITSIFANSEPEVVASLVKDLLSVAEIRRPSGNYDRVDPDADMSQHPKDVFPLVAFVLKEQFGSFFAGLPGSIGQA